MKVYLSVKIYVVLTLACDRQTVQTSWSLFTYISNHSGTIPYRCSSSCACWGDALRKKPKAARFK